MRSIVSILSFSLTSLQANPLQISVLDNGAEVWMQKNHSPPGMVFLNFLSENNHILSIQKRAAPSFDLEELLEYCTVYQENLSSQTQRAAIFAVGDFQEEELFPILANTLEPFELGIARAPSPQLESIQIHPSKGDIAQISFEYPYPSIFVTSRETLKERWIFFFLQALVHERLETSPQITPSSVSRFGFPRPIDTVAISFPERETISTLSDSLQMIQELKQNGFSYEEFEKIQSQIRSTIFATYSPTPNSTILADFFVDEYLFGSGRAPYHFCQAEALSIIEEISLKEVNTRLHSILDDGTRKIAIRTSSLPSLGDVEAVLGQFPSNQLTLSEEALAPKPAPKPAIDPFSTLTISEEESDIIYKIVDTLANTSTIGLGFKKKDLDKKGKKINHVHPLRFLAVVFSNPYLKKCMGEINDSYFKRTGFVDGLGERMDEEHSKNNLNPYIGGFSQTVKANPEIIKLYFDRRDWYGLVGYLIKV